MSVKPKTYDLIGLMDVRDPNNPRIWTGGTRPIAQRAILATLDTSKLWEVKSDGGFQTDLSDHADQLNPEQLEILEIPCLYTGLEVTFQINELGEIIAITGRNDT